MRSLHPKIYHQLNITAITPYLNEQGLITRAENEQLLSDHLAIDKRINKLIKWIPSKGSDALNRFIVCLQKSAEGTGTGHDELAKALEKEIREAHRNPSKSQDQGLGFLPSIEGMLFSIQLYIYYSRIPRPNSATLQPAG